MIYIMREAETGLFKVGKARDYHSALRERLPHIRRLRSIKLQRPCHLTLEHWLDWPGSSEVDIHRYCWQLWEGDEFFRDGPELRQVIAWKADGMGYAMLMKAIAAAGQSLPRRWSWMNRDKVIAQHKARLSPI